MLLKFGLLMAQLPASIVLLLHITQSQLWGGSDTVDGRVTASPTSETMPTVTCGDDTIPSIERHTAFGNLHAALLWRGAETTQATILPY